MDLHAAQANRAVERPLQALPRTAGERFEATFDESFAPDRYFTAGAAKSGLWQRAIDELHGATGQTFPNPYGAVTSEEMFRLGNQPAVTAERSQKIIEASRTARAMGNDTLFDPENIDRYIAEEARRRRDKAASYVDTGNGLAAFAGSMVGETLTPHGVAGLAIPVTRIPAAASLAVGKTFMGNVLREGAFQAGANAGLQAVAELFDYASRREFGTEQTTGEVLTNIAGAGVMGGLIGSGSRALHLAWLRLPERLRVEAPTEVKDAFRTIEADALYSGQNRLGVDPLLHERYQGKALDAVMRGRPVDLADLTRAADTPYSAIGRVLGAPDEIQVRGLEGIGTAMDRVRALPDREIEYFAREIAPRSFERLDKVEAELSQARARLAEIENRSLDVADLLDPETGMRLKEIEADLQVPALTRKQRNLLEDEREMILSTVDPSDRLPKKAEAQQRREAAAVRKEIEKIMAGHAEAEETARKAVQKLRGQLDAKAYMPGFEWAGTLKQLEHGLMTEAGFKAPADLAQAITRADIMRQARMIFETLPTGPEFRVGPAARTVEAPVIARAMDTETARLVETNAADFEVQIDGVTMSAKDALTEADRQATDAQIALGCAMGAL